MSVRKCLIGAAAISLCRLRSTPPAAAADRDPTTVSDLQKQVSAVSRMPAIPQPLSIRDWRSVAQAYYRRVTDPSASGGGFPAISVDSDHPSFAIKTYLGWKFDREAMTCLSCVIGAKLVGLNPRDLHGFDLVARSKSWYSDALGIYRDRPGITSPVVHDDIYGYWPAILGLMLADQYATDPAFVRQSRTAVAGFKQIAIGLGCPDHPDFGGLGWNFATRSPGGRDEPMNRLGSAPSVAWVLTVGSQMTGDDECARLARSALQWYIDHPGRYEISHAMGPLAAARLNAMNGAGLSLDAVLAAWFGDGDPARNPWFITAGTHCGGMTCDGLDGARWDRGGFAAFSMGSLQGPAWLVPVVRYDARYAKAIARYALNAANSCRMLQGDGLGTDRQDHAQWKAQWDPEDLFFYESLHAWDPSPTHQLRPYATGDVALFGWMPGHPAVPPDRYFAERARWFGRTPCNIALYMGNHVGFLGGILNTTNQPGILAWDCLATDWFHPPAYPTVLLSNPFDRDEEVALAVGRNAVDLYDLVQHRIIRKRATSGDPLRLTADTAAVLVSVPLGARWTTAGHHLLANDIVVDWQAP